jgi:hypothetical protein
LAEAGKALERGIDGRSIRHVTREKLGAASGPFDHRVRGDLGFGVQSLGSGRLANIAAEHGGALRCQTASNSAADAGCRPSHKNASAVESTRHRASWSTVGF